jgi:DNA repair exonuclease SbcCD ATPase subunit
MKLLTLRLENFKGIRRAEYRFDGQSANVYGKNGSGKTTLADGLTWLLFGKSSEGTPNFLPKVRGKDGEYIHNLENSVEGTFEHNGDTITLKKTLKENWTRRNGDSESELKGHKTEYWIDGVPSKEKEFSEYINGILPTDKVKILSNPFFFAEELPWQERRKILFSLCDEVTDDEVFGENPNLAELPALLGKRTVEQYQAVMKSQLSEINGDLDSIPNRIDEAERAIPDIAVLTLTTLDKDIGEAEAEKTELQTARANMGGSEASAKARTQIAELEAEYAERKRSYASDINAANQDTYEEISRLDKEISGLTRRIADTESEASALTAKAERMAKQRADLESQFKTAKVEVWEGDTTCYACGKPIDEDKIENAKSAFATKRKAKIDGILSDVKATCSKDTQAELEKNATDLTETAIADKKRLSDLKAERTSLNGKIKVNDFDGSDYAVETSAQISTLRKQAQDGEGVLSAAKQRIDTQIADVTARISKLTADKAKFGFKETQEQRIAELEKKEKALSAEREKCDKGLALCDDFIRAKSDIISRRICAKFRTVQFMFFKNQINGGLSECCEVLVPTDEGGLVPWGDANTAARYNAGIEIIDILSAAWRVDLPLILDQRERVTNIIDTDIQIISLFVSPEDRALRVEIKKGVNSYVA